MSARVVATDRPRQPATLIGPIAVVGVVVTYVALWLIARPADQPTGRYAGEIAGMLALLLMSLALVTSSGLMRVLEPAFGGFDRVMVWHRGLALAGVLLVIPHRILANVPNNPYRSDFGDGLGQLAFYGLGILVLWALAPRFRRAKNLRLITRLANSTYERWRIGHRLTGLFVAVATVHAALVDPVLHASGLLLAAELAAGGVGVAAYLYRELLAQRLTPVFHYTVREAKQLNRNTIEVGLSPIDKPIRLVAGQFIFLALGAPEQFAYHPFTVASAPAEAELRLSVRASGDYTERLYADLRPGIDARIVGPYGTFDYRLGERRQVWIAAGIGITPFISWIRALSGESFDYDVDFHYSVADDPSELFVNEIVAATERYPSLKLLFRRTDRDGRLTPEHIWAERPIARSSVYMCGPVEMMRAFEKGLRVHGVQPDHIRWEQFGLR
jgi:predicted ferric reductase